MSTKSITGILTAGILLSSLISACSFSSTHEIKPVEVKPIHITVDVNIKVERELDKFFDELDQKADELKDKKTESAGQTQATQKNEEGELK